MVFKTTADFNTMTLAWSYRLFYGWKMAKCNCRIYIVKMQEHVGVCIKKRTTKQLSRLNQVRDRKAQTSFSETRISPEHTDPSTGNICNERFFSSSVLTEAKQCK